ncbi:hypothetical protein ANTRET_LOCUS4766 [Anthophora retusa]
MQKFTSNGSRIGGEMLSLLGLDFRDFEKLEIIVLPKNWEPGCLTSLLKRIKKIAFKLLRNISSDTEQYVGISNVFCTESSREMRNGIDKLFERWEQIVNSDGEYIID